MPETEEQKQQFVACPVCEGSGRNKYGLACKNCGGLGLGVFHFDRFFYWGPKLGRATIELDHIREKANKAINFTAYVIAGIGMASLAVWINLVANNHSGNLAVEYLYFWQDRSPLIFLFWVGIIALMFIYYRKSEERRLEHYIKPLKYEDREKDVPSPNNWSELKRFNGAIDVSGGYDPAAREVVNQAFLLAKKLGHAEVTPKHLFYSALNDREVTALFARLNVNPQALTEKLEKQIAKISRHKSRTTLGNDTKKALVDAYLEAYNLGIPKVTAKNFLMPCMHYDKIINEILYDLEVEDEKIFNVIMWFSVNKKMVESYKEYRRKSRFKPSSNMNAAYTAIATPTLDHFGYDLTVQAKWNKLEYCVNRKKEMENVFQAFESGKNACLLVGPPGVGKSSMVDGIAQLMAQEDVPGIIKDMRLVEVDAARLVSGADAGQAEGRMITVLDEVAKSGNIILYIDNVENITGISSGSEGSLDLSEVLASNLEKKNFYCICSSTQENYTKYIEGKALDNTMHKVAVKEPEKQQAIQTIESKVSFIEGQKKVYFSYNAIETVVDMSRRYIHDSYLPKKAVDILESVAARTLKKKGEQSLVTRDDIAEVISEQTNIPLTKISEGEGETLLHLEDKIHENMINQEEAVKMVASSLRRARTELRSSERPIASFLFLGPTGVGKTQLAKTLSRVYFGSDEYMVRVDMSEYQHQDSVKKMIGDASGATGYLTDKVRKSPFAMVLLDEIEKAHSEILNLFLQVMDDGRLTDGRGRTVDFTNAIIIATSNAGAHYIEEAVNSGEETDIIKEKLINQELNQVMRPELINRFDGIVVFEPLSIEHIVAITELMLKEIEGMLGAKGIHLQATDEGIRRLAKQGYDPKFGARPLRRLLQEKIEDEIARKILSGEATRRDTVLIDEEGNIKIEKGEEL